MNIPDSRALLLCQPYRLNLKRPEREPQLSVIHGDGLALFFEHVRDPGFFHRERCLQSAARGCAFAFVEAHDYVAGAVLGGLDGFEYDVGRVNSEDAAGAAGAGGKLQRRV